MASLFRDILLFLIAASALTALASGAAWWLAEGRRLRRALLRALEARSPAVVVSHGRGAAFDLEGGRAAVATHRGRRVRVHDLADLVGAEMTVDRKVVARAWRGEGRKALDELNDEATEVELRLVFDDARDPDVAILLWGEGRRAGPTGGSSAAAVAEARRWLARTEAILRRATAVAPGQPRRDDDLFDDWDEDEA
jgi:hypothetical protein